MISNTKKTSSVRQWVLWAIPAFALVAGFTGGIVGWLVWAAPSEPAATTYVEPHTPALHEVIDNGETRVPPGQDPELWACYRRRLPYQLAALQHLGELRYAKARDTLLAQPHCSELVEVMELWIGAYLEQVEMPVMPLEQLRNGLRLMRLDTPGDAKMVSMADYFEAVAMLRHDVRQANGLVGHSVALANASVVQGKYHPPPGESDVEPSLWRPGICVIQTVTSPNKHVMQFVKGADGRLGGAAWDGKDTEARKSFELRPFLNGCETVVMVEAPRGDLHLYTEMWN